MRRPGDNKQLYLPGPNEFIPNDLSVDKQDAPTVCRPRKVTPGIIMPDRVATARAGAYVYPTHPLVCALVQERRSVLGPQGIGTD